MLFVAAWVLGTAPALCLFSGRSVVDSFVTEKRRAREVAALLRACSAVRRPPDLHAWRSRPRPIGMRALPRRARDARGGVPPAVRPRVPHGVHIRMVGVHNLPDAHVPAVPQQPARQRRGGDGRGPRGGGSGASGASGGGTEDIFVRPHGVRFFCPVRIRAAMCAPSAPSLAFAKHAERGAPPRSRGLRVALEEIL